MKNKIDLLLCLIFALLTMGCAEDLGSPAGGISADSSSKRTPAYQPAPVVSPPPAPAPAAMPVVSPPPLNVAAVALPGVVQAEDFSSGGEGVGFHDVDSQNLGGNYRNEAVDIKRSTDTGGGYAVGWIRTGEWLKYQVNVQKAGVYQVEFRMASGENTGRFRLEVDQNNVTGTMAAPYTGAWDTAYQSVIKTNLQLAAGLHTLTLVSESEYFDLDYMRFTLMEMNSPVASSCPAGSTPVAPGASVQTAVNSLPTNATICLKSGVHRLQEIYPKSGQTFVGEPGAILSGARELTFFSREGAYFVANGQTQERGAPSFIGGYVVCFAANPRCYHPEDLFINDQPLVHVDSLSKVGPGKFYFDYGADKIYFADDPAGKKVETSVSLAAFAGGAGNVTIRDLVVEKYANPAQTSAVGYGGAPGWVISNCEVRLNHGGGIETGSNAKILNNRVHRNGQIGIRGSGANALVEGNEISYNNLANYDYGFEGGGTKFAFTSNLVVRGNYVHHNNGPGLWTDIDNRDTLYENNRTSFNRVAGIFHEISYAAIIRNNTLENEQCHWGGCDIWYNSAIRVVDSSDVQIYGNTIRNSKNGIGVVGDGRAGAQYPNRNINAHDNRIEASPQAFGAVGVDMGGIVFMNNTVLP